MPRCVPASVSSLRPFSPHGTGAVVRRRPPWWLQCPPRSAVRDGWRGRTNRFSRATRPRKCAAEMESFMRCKRRNLQILSIRPHRPPPQSSFRQPLTMSGRTVSLLGSKGQYVVSQRGKTILARTAIRAFGRFLALCTDSCVTFSTQLAGFHILLPTRRN